MKSRLVLLLAAFLPLAWDAPPARSQKGDRWDYRDDRPRSGLSIPNAGTVNRWRIGRTSGGVTLQVDESSKYAGWYLNYDHRGKDVAVLLTPELGPGCVWDISEVRRGE